MKHTSKILFFLILLLFSGNLTFAAKTKTFYVRITSSKGQIIVKLYNETPKNRDNFVKNVKKGVYNGTLFHRVIADFMIQGGDPSSKNAKPGAILGNGGLGYTVPAEFNPDLFHKKGALAAARDGNLEKASSSTQFYLVQGRVFTDDELNRIEQTSLQGRKIPLPIRQVYKTIGGTPHLDQNYTVFGEVVRGLDKIDSIASVEKDGNDRPLIDIPVKIALLKKREIKKLENELIKESFRKNLIM